MVFGWIISLTTASLFATIIVLSACIAAGASDTLQRTRRYHQRQIGALRRRTYTFRQNPVA